ncbi:alpha/beta fold hydrolase [Nocardia sp. ET3-3]|uniref:Alpha/beta fold hydrolase n=1 Tax=Nocardia terrae TaxID=2675851 RepID=A0A7K1UW36_9NOCA|nr:SDR family oxidoreductase [Nocardia terrae]MVU78600.1 alpha/beta fold hydrolase [Nocardia terrae]
MTTADRHALVFGATGFLGRHLILALDRAGVRIIAATRSATSFTELTAWLGDRGRGVTPTEVRVDFDSAAPVSGDESRRAEVSEFYNCAGAYRRGMTEAQARHANVDSVRSLISFAARLPKLARVVHVSGYPRPVHVITGSDDPLTDEARDLLESLGPRIEVTAVAGAGHHPQLTHPEELTTALTRHTVPQSSIDPKD